MRPRWVQAVILSWALLAPPTLSQWQTGNNAAPAVEDELQQQLADFEANKCSNGGAQTKAFIDFSTTEPKERQFVTEVGHRFSQIIQQRNLGVSFSGDSARSVQFIFEVNREGEVETLTVFASPEEQGLRDFVTQLVTQSVPYPSFNNAVASCFETVVLSAILDF